MAKSDLQVQFTLFLIFSLDLMNVIINMIWANLETLISSLSVIPMDIHMAPWSLSICQASFTECALLRPFGSTSVIMFHLQLTISNSLYNPKSLNWK